MLLDVSTARTVMLCDPAATLRVFQDALILRRLEVATTRPSISISMDRIATLSVAVAAILITPETAAPLTGLLMRTTGAAVSPGTELLTFTLITAELPILP